MNGTAPDTRWSDADRDAVVAELRRHAVERRLEPAELEARLGDALDASTQRELRATLENLPPATREITWNERLAAISRSTATAVIVAVLAIMLWLTGHLGEDGVMWTVAAAILLLVWRRPRSPRDT
jgi:Domain of unknown function (DUF1707)